MSELPGWLPLAVKILFPALTVVSATALAERSGPLLAGIVMAMPVSIGPVYVMLALTAPPQFVAASAVGSIAANLAVAAFGTVYVLLAPRLPMPASLAAALVAWFGVAASMQHGWHPAAWLLALLGTAALVAATYLTRRALAGRRLLAGAKRWYDLPLRAVFVGCFAAALVTASQAIGPGWTGMFAAFPLVLTSSIVLLHSRVGAAATAAAIATAIQGIVAYPAALYLLHRFCVGWGVWWAMLACLAAIVGWAGLVYWWRAARAAPRPPAPA
ncbi:MAG: hypothetical protein JNM90_05830 [Burkholderiales bacterium]|nr:hypothetical protein [Burkholderiales bacterium]